MSNLHQEELASLEALGLLDPAGQSELSAAMERDPGLERLVRELTETTASLAYASPQIAPPPEFKRNLLRQLPARPGAAKIIAFPYWVPYALAACLMALAIVQAALLVDLHSRSEATRTQLLTANTEVARLTRSNALLDLRLTTLEAQNVAYVSARVVVAWDPSQHRGVISLRNLPAPAPGHDYQLWVLDPHALAPLSAGIIAADTQARPFASAPSATPAPGFAISLEPKGGSAVPTPGAILFAVAPGA